ncbi:MAG: metalloregulator ArsR/SmtB family transcription factor [Patescibacteria group bacterium]|mgnify:CR=1 FL=1
MASNERLTLLFRALGDPGRYRLVKFLARREQVCVSDVARSLGVSVPVASQQLRVLFVNGLVKRERRGQKAYYGLIRTNATLKALAKMML